jgi:hypothetical protein
MSPVHPDVARQDIYAACVHTAVHLGTSVAHRMLARAERSALERAAATLDEDERKWQIEAAQLLSRHQDTICAAYPDALRREFSTPGEADSPKPKALSFESLELMAEDQVDETVELVRAQQAVLSAVESELTQLNALISAAQGEEIVRASANPLRPQAWVRALRDATLQCPVPAAVRLRWMHHLSEALGPELAAVYRQLCQLLRTQGVTAASFAVNMPSTRDGTAAMQRVAPAPAASALQPLLNLRDLRRLLIGDKGRPRGSQVDARPTLDAASETVDTGLTVPWSFQVLQEMKQVDQVLQRMQQRRASGGQAAPAVARAGGPSTITPAQALSQEVVKLMVENIASDQRLLPQVQQAVRDLEPPLLRLVQNDPRFFNDKQHPTRQFLSEITQRSLAWSSVDAPGFTDFFEPLRQAIDALAALPIENAEPFEFALHSLKQAWGEQEERNRRHRARAARVLLKAEKRNLVAERIAGDMRSRPDMSTAPGEIRRFLTGPWSQVMAAAHLADASGAADPGGYAGIINDLIWTTQPRLAAQNPGRLAKLVPPLLHTLRHGLASIEYPADATQRLLDYLTDQHQMALRAPTDAAAVPEPMSRDELDSYWGKEQARPEVWLEQTEARESGLMERIPDAALDWRETLGPDHADTQPISAESPMALSATDFLPGVWADVFINGAWSRWQLAWASPHSLLFMFTDGSGKYQSMTRSMLDKMVALGALRVMSQTVLEGALDAVAQKALRNSTDSAP